MTTFPHHFLVAFGIVTGIIIGAAVGVTVIGVIGQAWRCVADWWERRG